MRQVIWIVGILILVLTSCKYQSKQTDSKIDRATLVRDTLRAVITDTIETRFIARNKPLWTPTKDQFDQIDSILIRAIKDTLAITNNDFKIKNINGFYRQYVCYQDDNGDLIVFVNAFCHLLDKPVDSCGTVIWKKYDWKNDLLTVNDGGPCYWSIKINLTRKKHFNFLVNGVA
jgi:hypothetical protein